MAEYGRWIEINQRPLCHECQPRYHQAKATKRGGKGGRKSQRLDSTVEAGELALEDPVEGSEASTNRLN